MHLSPFGGAGPILRCPWSTTVQISKASSLRSPPKGCRLAPKFTNQPKACPTACPEDVGKNALEHKQWLRGICGSANIGNVELDDIGDDSPPQGESSKIAASILMRIPHAAGAARSDRLSIFFKFVQQFSRADILSCRIPLSVNSTLLSHDMASASAKPVQRARASAPLTFEDTRKSAQPMPFESSAPEVSHPLDFADRRDRVCIGCANGPSLMLPDACRDREVQSVGEIPAKVWLHRFVGSPRGHARIRRQSDNDAYIGSVAGIGQAAMYRGMLGHDPPNLGYNAPTHMNDSMLRPPDVSCRQCPLRFGMSRSPLLPVDPAFSLCSFRQALEILRALGTYAHAPPLGILRRSDSVDCLEDRVELCFALRFRDLLGPSFCKPLFELGGGEDSGLGVNVSVLDNKGLAVWAAVPDFGEAAAKSALDAPIRRFIPFWTICWHGCSGFRSQKCSS